MNIPKRFKSAVLAALLLLTLVAGAQAAKNYPFTASEDADGARFVWFVFKESGSPFPYFSAKNFRLLERFRSLTVEAPAAGDVLWWSDYMAVYSKDTSGADTVLSAVGREPLEEVLKKRGKPAYLRYVPIPEPKKQPSEADLKKFAGPMGKLSKVAESYPVAVSGDEELKKAKAAYADGEKIAKTLLETYPDAGPVRLVVGRLYRYGHNLEMGSWDKARDNLTKAMTLMPDNPQPYLELGLLLVNTSLDYADNAEYLFSEAMRLSVKDDVVSTGLRGLVFARYYKGDMEGALATADKYLKKWPKDQRMIDLRKNIEVNPIKKDKGGKTGGTVK